MKGEHSGARASDLGACSNEASGSAPMGPVTRRALRVREAIAQGRYHRDLKAVAEAFVIREFFDLEVSD